jgi:hypothetical protein
MLAIWNACSYSIKNYSVEVTFPTAFHKKNLQTTSKVDIEGQTHRQDDLISPHYKCSKDVRTQYDIASIKVHTCPILNGYGDNDV